MEISTLTIENGSTEVNIIERSPGHPVTLLKTKIVLLEVNKNETYNLRLEVFSPVEPFPIFVDTYTINEKEFNFRNEEHLYNNFYALSFISNLPVNITKTGLYFIKVSFLEQGKKKEQQMSFFVK